MANGKKVIVYKFIALTLPNSADAVPCVVHPWLLLNFLLRIWLARCISNNCKLWL